MTIRTVGGGGTHPFTQAGLMAAISACASSGDTVRFMQAGSISSVLQSYPAGPATAYNVADKAIAFDSDPALYLNNNPTSLPKLLFGGGTAVKCFDNVGIGSSFAGLQLEGFSRAGSSFDSGVIQCRSHASITGDNLLFIDCLADCFQFCAGGTFSRIRGLRTGALFRQSDGITCKRFWVRAATGFQYGIHLGGTASTSAFYLGAIYLPGVTTTDLAINAGATCPIVDCSAYRASGSGAAAWLGTVSYCTQTGFATSLAGGAVDGGNNQARNPLFVDAPNGNFHWQAGSSEFTSGTAVAGITEDLDGLPMPLGGWARGPYSADFTAPTVTSIVALGHSTVRVTFSEAVKPSSLTLDRFQILPVQGEAIEAPVITSLTPMPGSAPTYVDLNLTGGLRNRRMRVIVLA